MGIVCSLKAVDEGQINEFLTHPESYDEFIEEGWESVDDGEMAETHVYLDKAWHGIHFLLTGSEWGGEEPWCYLVKGGEVIGDEEVGYWPVRALRPNQVAAWSAALSTISTQELRKRFSTEAMIEADIYPRMWGSGSGLIRIAGHRMIKADIYEHMGPPPEEDDTLEYVIEYFEALRSFLERTKNANRGTIITIS